MFSASNSLSSVRASRHSLIPLSFTKQTHMANCSLLPSVASSAIIANIPACLISLAIETDNYSAQHSMISFWDEGDKYVLCDGAEKGCRKGSNSFTRLTHSRKFAWLLLDIPLLWPRNGTPCFTKNFVTATMRVEYSCLSIISASWAECNCSSTLPWEVQDLKLCHPVILLLWSGVFSCSLKMFNTFSN